MARTKNTEIKELHPKDADAKYLGTEPKFNVVEGSDKKWELVRAMNWYNHFYDNKDAREFIVQYLEANDKHEIAKTVSRVSDNQIVDTYGWVARSIMRGYQADDELVLKLNNEIDRLVKTVSVVQKEEKPTSNRPNVQEIMRERTLEAGGELEGRWDEYVLTGAKKESTINAIQVLSESNILPQHVGMLIDAWKNKLDEYIEVQSGKDEQLNEAYGKYGKVQIRNMISTIESVISELNSYINIKKSDRKPRKKKPVPVEKIVKKLKYLKTFKLEKLELTSISPTKLHGCAEAWVYDTKKRKLHHYVADEYSRSLAVKGNTVIGFCTKQSEIKTLRKPDEQIKEIMGSKPAARKFFNNIKAVATTPNGRFNSEMIILRAF